MLRTCRLTHVSSEPALVDVVLAAHVLLLTEPAYADPLLKTLLVESYPALVQHAERVRARAGEPPRADAVAVPSLASLLPSATRHGEPPAHEFAIRRWALGAAGLAGVVAVLLLRPQGSRRWAGQDTELEGRSESMRSTIRMD
jgi:hypothetical protein